MNTFFKNRKKSEQLQEGPLGRYLLDYVAQLQAEGYAHQTGRFKIRLVAQFSQWMNRQGVVAETLCDKVVERFLRSRRRHGYRIAHTDPSALSRMLRLLRSRSVILETPKMAPTPSDAMLEAYACYLEKERGLVLKTRDNYLPFVRQLLDSKFGSSPIDLSALQMVDIVGFVSRSAARMSAKHAQLMTTALRSFLRFAQYQGDTAAALAACVPTVANWSLSTVPKDIARRDVERVLAKCNRKTVSGRRDYAVLMLLARLGLRAGEIANLALDDIDWDVGCITIRGKAGRIDKLPLPSDVGQAIAAYLKSGRPQFPKMSVQAVIEANRGGFLHA